MARMAIASYGNALTFEQPQCHRDQGGDEKRDDEDILKLSEDALPSGDGLLRHKLVPAKAFQPRPGLRTAYALPRRRAQFSEHLVGRLPIGRVILRRDGVDHRAAWWKLSERGPPATEPMQCAGEHCAGPGR
jgi:hypothetical protein